MRRSHDAAGSELVTLTGSGVEPLLGVDRICIVIEEVRPALDTI